MIDAVQVVLLIVITILTVLLVVLGIQVFFILKTFRGTLGRLNSVLDNTDYITENIAKPIGFISNLSEGTQTVSSIVKFLTTKKREQE